MNNESNTRRPIASRESNWAKKSAQWLAHKNISPNTISLFSIVFAMLSFLGFYLSYKYQISFLWMILAILGIQGRLIMNLLDGMVAVEYNKKSPNGALYNEVPDRISDTIILFGVGLCASPYQYGLDMAYIAITLALATAYIRTLGASIQEQHFFSGPMAKPHRMAIITVACIPAIWYPITFYYVLIIMNIGLVITCYRRLSKITNALKP